MHYDPIKDKLGSFFNGSIFMRKLFYRLLDLLLLRTWHIHREIKKWKKENPAKHEILDAGSGFGQYSSAEIFCRSDCRRSPTAVSRRAIRLPSES